MATNRDIELQRQRKPHASEVQGPSSCIELQLPDRVLDGVEVDLLQPRAPSLKVCHLYIFKVSSLTTSREQFTDTVILPIRYGNSTVENQRGTTKPSSIIGRVIPIPCSFSYAQSILQLSLSNYILLDGSVLHDSCLVSHRDLQDPHPWFRFPTRHPFSNTRQYIHGPQPIFQRDQRTRLDSHTTMGPRISTIFTAECCTSQTWPNARLSL